MPTNTAKDERHPEWTMGGDPGAIRAQEARGQQELASDDTLPSKINMHDKAKLEEAGVVFGEPVSGDSLFTHVKLPPGWKKKPTDHSMWSELVDAEGVKRASIFYKAAFYDRDAFLNLV